MRPRSWVGGVGPAVLLAGLALAAAPPPPGGPDEPTWDDDPLYRVCAALASWWPGDGHALDLAGGNHANRAGPVRFGKGQAGAAFSFSGNPGEAVAAGPAPLTGTFTLALWARPGASRQTATPLGLPRYLGTSGQRYAVYPTYGGPEGKRAGCGLSVGTNGVGVFEHTYDNLPAVLAHEVPVKGWVHVACAYDRGRPTLYVDGKAVRTGATSAWAVFPGTMFGEGGNLAYGPFHGLVDEVVLLGRALNAHEVAALMKATRAGPGRRPLSEATFARLWHALSGRQAPRSLFAVHRLAASGDEAVRRLRPRLRPPADAGKPSVAELIRQLDADSFAVRERATRALVERGPAAAPRLRAALRGKVSLEARRRIERVLRQLKDPPLTPEELRAARAVAALARIDTPASRALLAEVAGWPDTPAASAARAALGRPAE
jgi:hypothetical protein